MNIAVSTDRAWNLLSSKLEDWFEIIIKGLPNFVVAVVVLFLFYLFARLAKRVAQTLLKRITGHESVKKLAASSIYLVVISVGVFVSLGILHLDKTVTSLLAGAGVVGLALGFAFQDIATNFVSGIFIAFKKPYQLGDIVKTQDFMGNVTSIDYKNNYNHDFSRGRNFDAKQDSFY